MYADRGKRGGFSPGSLGLALGINAAVMGALAFVNPGLVTVTPADPPIEIFAVPPVPDPDPLPKPEAKSDPTPRPIERITTTRPLVERPAPDDGFVVPDGPYPPPPGDGGIVGGTGTGVAVDPPLPPLPVILGPEVDPRFARSLQPDYPAGERRLENEGRVVVRVLVGVDGRVKQVERISATSDAFFRATQMQALSHWRFRPGTRDGVAVEAWRRMAVTFVLDE